MKTLLIALIVGLAAGLVGALCGVGGGIVMVPAFVHAVGMEQKQAVATSLAVILFTALAATLVNQRGGYIDWRVVAMVSIGAVTAAVAGSFLMRSMSNVLLTRIFGVVLLVFGAKMLFFTSAK